MWLRARTNAYERDLAYGALRRSQIDNTIASAVIDSRRAEYELARQNASRFFTDVRAELDNPHSTIFSAAQKEQLRTLMTPRDEVITLLSRNDPASVERLLEVYVAYRNAVAA